VEVDVEHLAVAEDLVGRVVVERVRHGCVCVCVCASERARMAALLPPAAPFDWLKMGTPVRPERLA
jgi:hypothetical protein